MEDQEPPKIEFPCQYPIKVLGSSGENFESTILDVVETHAPGFDRETITMKVSRKGTFSSITIVITAAGPVQLDELHKGLLATGIVKMVI